MPAFKQANLCRPRAARDFFAKKTRRKQRGALWGQKLSPADYAFKARRKHFARVVVDKAEAVAVVRRAEVVPKAVWYAVFAHELYDVGGFCDKLCFFAQ